jgi:hypothetical protein
VLFLMSAQILDGLEAHNEQEQKHGHQNDTRSAEGRVVGNHPNLKDSESRCVSSKRLFLAVATSCPQVLHQCEASLHGGLKS